MIGISILPLGQGVVWRGFRSRVQGRWLLEQGMPGSDSRVPVLAEMVVRGSGKMIESEVAQYPADDLRPGDSSNYSPFATTVGAVRNIYPPDSCQQRSPGHAETLS